MPATARASTHCKFSQWHCGGRKVEISVSLVHGSLLLPSTSATCTPALLWWGFTCISGTLTTDQEIASASSTAFGVNGGVGFTARVGEAPYRFYVESRYHYAPTKNFSTQIVIVSFGIRY